MADLVKSISYDQEEIIKNIMFLQGIEQFDLDPTYSKGVFWKNITPPALKFDLYPKTEDTIQASAEKLPLETESLDSIMFDPPFLVGHTKSKNKSIIKERFGEFRTIPILWSWYFECLIEFQRLLKKKGTLVFKCQDTVSGGKNHFSHVKIINMAEDLGFYTKDLYVLLAKSRMIGWNCANQQHARKFHSYFLVFEKR